VKVLAKLGLVTAAAATVLFIFIYEFQGPVLNRAMAEPPNENNTQAVTEENSQETTETAVSADDVSTNQLVPIDETVDAPGNILEGPTNSVEQPDETIEQPVESLEEPVQAVEEPAQTIEEPVKVVEKPVVESKFDPNRARRIYGKITLSTSGEQLEGVNIMVPGSNVAKISNATGGYTIQVPKNTKELVFIYRGKKLVQRISSENNLVNVRLNLETMQYD